MSARDHNDGREMPPNGQSHISVNTRSTRGPKGATICVLRIMNSYIYTFTSYLLQIGVHILSHVNLISSFLFPIPHLRILHILKKKTYKEHRTFIRMVI